MEAKANEYLELLSASDFHGEIHLRQTTDDSTEIRLFSSNGTEIKKPSGSQLTVMYISVLFAISDFTQEKRDEDYPLILMPPHRRLVTPKRRILQCYRSTT